MSLSEKIREDMFEARKSGDVLRSNILGMALAALKNAQIEMEKEMNVEDEINVLRREAKKLQDAAQQYTQAGNSELAKKEADQLEILNGYLPSLMGAEEIEKVVSAKIEELGASGMQDIGNVMRVVMEDLKGKADGGLVSESVKKSLSK